MCTYKTIRSDRFFLAGQICPPSLAAVVTWIDNLDAVCGPLTVAARRFALEQGFPEDPPRGAPALRRLLKAIDERSQAQDDAPDEPFIEGAGAFLGVVLAERLQTASHVQDGPCHGLRLGRHGYFDPFACVAQTLSADVHAEALLSGIAEAEAEAKAQTHAARVTAALGTRVEQLSRGALTLVQRVGERVWLRRSEETVEVDIRGLLAATLGESEALVDEIVSRFAAALTGNEVASLHGWADARTRILPRLVGRAFDERMARANRGDGLQRMEGPCGLQIAFVVQYEGRARYVRSSELSDWGVTPAQALSAALGNLRKRPIRLLRLDDGSVMVRTGDGHDSARVLLPEVQDALADALQQRELVIALPHRDGLFACAADDRAACQRLARKAQAEAERAPHALSPSLWPLSMRD